MEENVQLPDYQKTDAVPGPGLYPTDKRVANIYAGRETAEEYSSRLVKAQEGSNSFSLALDAGYNNAYSVWQDFERLDKAGARDPLWSDANKEAFIKAHGDIEGDQQWRWMQTKNAKHADMLYTDYISGRDAQEKLSMRGNFGSYFLPMAAGVVDFDSVLSLGAGALVKGAGTAVKSTRMGMLMAGTSRYGQAAIAGGASMAASQALGYEANPNGQVADILVAGLAGAAFGAIAPGGKVHAELDHVNKQAQKMMDEVDGSIKDGIIDDATPPVHGASDDFGVHAQRQKEADAYEAALAAKPAEGETKVEPVMPDHMAAADALAGVDQPDPFGAGSVGAGFQNQSFDGPGIRAMSEQGQDAVRRADAYLEANNFDKEWFGEEDLMRQKFGKKGVVAYKVKQAIDSVPGMANNFEKFANSGSSIAAMFAHKALTNAAGIVRNVSAADQFKQLYNQQLMVKLVPREQAYKGWLEARHPGLTMVEKQLKHWELRKQFNDDVVIELQARWHGRGVEGVVDPNVKMAADAGDAFHMLEVDIGNGLPGEHARYGYDKLEKRAGYHKQSMRGEKLDDELARLASEGYKGKAGKERIIGAISKAIMATNGNAAITEEKALIYAQAMFERARLNNLGIGTDISAMLAASGRDAVEELLARNGASASEIKKTIDGLLGLTTERTKPGHLKERVNIDLRMEFDGIKMLNIMDTNLDEMYAKRANSSAGMSAMARIGLPDMPSITNMRNNIVKELEARGKPIMHSEFRANDPSTYKHLGEYLSEYLDKPKGLSTFDLDAVLSNFTGQPVNGGFDPNVTRLMQYTRLATLGQVGMAQAAESGMSIAAVGYREWSETIGKDVKATIDAIRSGKEKVVPEFIKDLQALGYMVPEHRLFRETRQFETDRFRMGDGRSFMDKVDRGLQTGNHLQGYLSGLFHIMESQRNAIVMTRMNQLFKGLTGRGEAISAERLRDMGFKPEDMPMLTKYAHAAVWHDNKLIRTGIDQWTPEHQQYIMMRVQSEINNLIQQVSIGEGNVLGQRNALFGIMLQLKSFVMAASNKQFYRNIRIGDKQTQMSMLWGTVMGSLMFEVKSLINGDTENLTPLKAVKGGFGMSNMTGWMPMWTDPIAGILGLDNLGVGTDSRGQGHILKPAAYSVLSGLSEIPGLPMDAMTGNLTPSELRNLSYLPLGRMYGVPLMRNEFSNLVLK